LTAFVPVVFARKAAAQTAAFFVSFAKDRTCALLLGMPGLTSGIAPKTAGPNQPQPAMAQAREAGYGGGKAIPFLPHTLDP
jgi:hypothetical protein